jgi:cation diffusion facilitator family transporter
VRDFVREKQAAALRSLLAAVGLTAFKIVVGVATGSLGILAEAAHSGLDLVAAGLTFIAVRLSGRPADREHLYGHGKIENVSALGETLLLLLTCAWIAWEAVHRLVAAHHPGIHITVWAFVVMLTSIVVDLSRSRLLMRAARQYHSQALEADALHFATDVWSSSVVILGLVAVKVSDSWPRLTVLRHADAIAALGVCVVVVWVSTQLGRRTLDALIDRAPEGMEQRIIAAVQGIDGVRDCHNVRMRSSGPILFIDLHVLVDGEQSLAHAHSLTETIEEVIRGFAPNADVTVHPEPF